MPVGESYRRQAALLVSIVPFVAAEKCFALKGGTAINLFVRDLPRISVDLDLTYLPVADRDTSLTAIDARDAPSPRACVASPGWPSSRQFYMRWQRHLCAALAKLVLVMQAGLCWSDGAQIQHRKSRLPSWCVHPAALRSRFLSATGLQRGSKSRSALLKFRSFPFRTFTAARSSPRSIASIHSPRSVRCARSSG